MSDEEITEIRETARAQFDTERQKLELQEVQSDLAKELLREAKDADSLKQKRMALAEVRKVKKDIEESQQKQEKISERPLEELWDELIRLVEREEAKRSAEADREPA